MKFRTALHGGKVARIEVLDGDAKVIIDKISSTRTGTDSISRALEAWESDPAKDMFNMLYSLAGGESFDSKEMQKLCLAYKQGKQEPFIERDPKAIVIKLSYSISTKLYLAQTQNNHDYHKNPFEAIKLILEDHNYDVHEEMYTTLKSIQNNVNEVIKRYESK